MKFKDLNIGDYFRDYASNVIFKKTRNVSVNKDNPFNCVRVEPDGSTNRYAFRLEAEVDSVKDNELKYYSIEI